ncbi:O-antigen ligase family protein [Sphingomonas sp. HT-1]|uniref:O-antigen ligase family protein n=1 Tax=unclassified Sphingomonas TaxID=196159 RepID=UPI00037147F9|nr:MULTISPECIES: O-antigen ligase family protein [unclassified Sphingomonas]KTF67428.1 hypothetical protein ATB93_17700 [Sphingomonas sp. WG]
MRATVFRPARPVLPLYAPERSGLAVLGRRSALLLTVIIIAMFYGLLVAILPARLLIPAAAPMAVLALIVIWALPEAKRPPIQILIGCYIAFVLLTILWPNYLSVAAGGLPWISVRRLLGVVTSLVFLLCYSMSAKFRLEIKDIMKSSPLLARFALGFLVLQAVSTFVSTAPGSTIGRLISATLTITPFFFLTLWVAGTRRFSSDAWLKMMLSCLLILMMIGFLEFRSEHIIWVNNIPSFLKINDDRVAKIFVPQYRDHYRVVTVFATPLAWGEFIALIAPFVLHCLANARSLKSLIAFALFDIMLLVSAYMSGARLSMVGVIVAHAIYLLLWGVKRWRSDRGGLIGITTTMLYPAFALVLAAMIFFVPAVHNRVLGGGATQVSNDGRREQWQLGIPAVAKRPLFGYGPGEGAGAVGWRAADGTLSIDSGFLSMAADYGVLGFVAYYGAIVLMALQLATVGLRTAVPRYPIHLALAVSLVVLMFTKSVLSQIENEHVVYMLLGLGFALLYRSKIESGTQPLSRAGE